MKGGNRMAAVAAIVAAGVLTIAQARSGNAMSSGLVDGSRAVAHRAERVVMAISDKVAGLFGDESRHVRVSVDVKVREDGARQVGDFTWRGAV